MGSTKLDKYGIINYYKDSHVQCMGPVYCEKKKISDSGQFFYLGEGGWAQREQEQKLSELLMIIWPNTTEFLDFLHRQEFRTEHKVSVTGLSHVLTREGGGGDFLTWVPKKS
jgi:glutamine cyclotransferase